VPKGPHVTDALRPAFIITAFATWIAFGIPGRAAPFGKGSAIVGAVLTLASVALIVARL
jgi:2-methylcitrate dehydratase PrpD